MKPRFSDKGEYTAQPVMLCSLCKTGFHTHIEFVLIAGRDKEDHPVRRVALDSRAKEVRLDDFPLQGSGRRHSVGLVISCEECGGWFLIEFNQHKGNTFTRVVRVPENLTAEALDSEIAARFAAIVVNENWEGNSND